MLSVYDLSKREEWDKIVRSFQKYDVYYLSTKNIVILFLNILENNKKYCAQNKYNIFYFIV